MMIIPVSYTHLDVYKRQDEYMPYDRLQQDVAMMKKAGINTVRITESTWSTCEPQEGVFDLSLIHILH